MRDLNCLNVFHQVISQRVIIHFFKRYFEGNYEYNKPKIITVLYHLFYYNIYPVVAITVYKRETANSLMSESNDILNHEMT